MKKGKTKSGFEFQIEDSNLDNMELLDALAEIDGGNVAALPRASALLLGNEQKKSLYNHLRSEKGNVPMESFMDEITEIMKIIGEDGKNS